MGEMFKSNLLFCDEQLVKISIKTTKMNFMEALFQVQ